VSSQCDFYGFVGFKTFSLGVTPRYPSRWAKSVSYRLL